MPNWYNFEFKFEWASAIIYACFTVGFFFNYTFLLAQRRKFYSSRAAV